MNERTRTRINNQSLLTTYLAEERRRAMAESDAQPRPSVEGRGGGDYFVIGALIALQLIVAVVILTILFPFGEASAGPDEIASFGAPSTEVEAEWVRPEQPSPEPDPVDPVDPVDHGTAGLDSISPSQEVAAPQPKASSINIRGLEITQGIQVFNEPEHSTCQNDPNSPYYVFCNNSVPLVAGRHTLLRLYLACHDSCPSTETEVRLRVLKAGQEQTVLTQRLSTAWLPQLNNLPLTDLRLKLDHSVNFEFFPPPAWLSGPIAFEIEATPENGSEAPATLTLTKNFIVRRPLRVAYLPIQHQGLLPPDLPDLDRWLLRLYPVPEVEYYRLPVPDLVWDKELNKGELLNELLYTYWLYTQHNPPETWPDQLFGWLSPELYNGGAADPTWCTDCAGPHSGRVAFGGMRPELDIGAPRILAHEIAHNLGAQHAWSPTAQADSGCFRTEGADIQVDPAWPYAQSPYIQEVGVDLYSDPPLIYPPHYYDMMSYCSQPWISPHTYAKIFESPLLQQEIALSPPSADFKPKKASAEGRTLLVSGVIHPDGSVSRLAVTQFDEKSALGYTNTAAASSDNYCLNIQSNRATLLAQRCFEVGFLNVETGLPVETAPFFVAISHINMTEVAKISLTKGESELVALIPSRTPPQVTLIFPNNGELLRGRQTITWEGSDADGDSLTYDVLYSSDGGQRWAPLVTRLKETHYTIDPEHLTAGRQALIRIIAGDGFHTTADESDLPFTIALDH